MAFIDVNDLYKKGKIKNSTNRSTGDNTLGGGVHSTQAEYGLYRNDEQTRDDFPDFVGMLSPLFNSYQNSDGQISDQSDHSYQYINKYKVVDIAVTSPGGSIAPTLESPLWGSWRTQSANIKVDPRVLLFSSEKTFQFAYTNEYGSAWEKLSSGGLLSKVSQAAEALRNVAALAGEGVTQVGGKFMSKYEKAPSWNGTKPISLSSSLKFNFSFGQAGLFSGEEEVVKPVLALAKLFSPVATSGNYWKGPVPTPPYYMFTFFKTIAREAKGIGEDLAAGVAATFTSTVSGGGAGAAVGGLATTLSTLENKIITAMDTAIGTALSDSGSRALCVRIGRMAFGPMIVKDVNWEFDFTQTDDFGFPYKGSLTFGGLESVIMPNPGLYDAPFKRFEGKGAEDWSIQTSSEGRGNKLD